MSKLTLFPRLYPSPADGVNSRPMGMFHDLMAKILGHAPAAPPSAGVSTAPGVSIAAAPPATPAEAASGGSATPAPGQATTPTTQASGSSPAAPATVDVTAVLNGMAAKNPESLDWKRSIVDLLKLVGMDSSFSARKRLAEELHYPGDTSDSATMNVWLHQQVMKQLAQNGGTLPPELGGF